MDLIREQRNLETLGHRLQATRESRDMSPLQLAAVMESSLTSIRDWENGARKLQSATVRRLAEALELSYPEEMYWLGLSGHIPSTRMPAKKQIIQALSAYYEDLERLPFPAQIIDHHFTYWIVNSATIDFVGSREGLIAMMQNKLTALDVVFNSQIGFFHRISRPEELINRQKQLARRIMGRSLHRRHENFYQDYPTWLKGRMSPEDYQIFTDIWEEANAVNDEHLQRPRLEDDIMLRYFEFQYPNERVRRLQMRADHLRHFGDIFEITLFYPYAGGDSHDFPPSSSDGIKLWEVADVDHLLRTYET
ncbi:MAG: helix-turn-helix transcriptional regulator [Chloroflexota bacterium]